MILALTGFSLLVGVACPFFGSTSFVIYFSIAAAAAIALLAGSSGSSAGIIFLAWLATIVATQVGFALSVVFLAMRKPKRSGALYLAEQHKQLLPFLVDQQRSPIPARWTPDGSPTSADPENRAGASAAVE
jgi:hypothetical protein